NLCRPVFHGIGGPSNVEATTKGRLPRLPVGRACYAQRVRLSRSRVTHAGMCPTHGASALSPALARPASPSRALSEPPIANSSSNCWRLVHAERKRLFEYT